MATIYTHKDANIRKTYVLFTLFFVLVIGAGWAFSYIYQTSSILVFAVILSSILSIVSYWYSDKIVLSMAHAVPVEEKDYPELFRIVENLSITAGLPMPKVYVIEEEAMNAFATGRNPQHAVVAVTRGLLRRLNKVELEGVIAHELSHIGNRDMAISTMVVILVGFLSLLSDMFMRSMWFRAFSGGDNDNRQSGGPLFILGIAVAILAPLGASLMQLAISRKREFLADASGALLTRYPEGLASALQKISSDSVPLQTANTTTAHLWVSDPFKDGAEQKTPWIHKMFMTHPPVEERISALKNMSL
ncbi:zinc metalloprotease HtpX [Candidatus Parcubacteria bacterium]|jgi:heat shock protein HtpX|nr:MAG: zinc metalloprotease HtpX [Candidatus Parcubacteria bacterium]